MAVAPDNFGQFSNALLVGNFGDSHVNAFNLKTGAFLGQLTDAQGNPLVLNGGFQESDTKGLWGIGFGNGQGGAATNTLFFAAGINDENDGLFGKVTVADEDFGHNGVVVKAPHFYEDYVGPKLAQLNAVAAAGELLPNGSFEFVGVNQGTIDPKVQATYVFGVDRNGKLPTGPFPGRPDIRFDALVVVTLKPGQAPTASVLDLANHKTTDLPQGSLRIEGNAVGGQRPGEPAPLDGPRPLAVPVQLLARGRQPGLDPHRQLRPRVQRRPGRGDRWRLHGHESRSREDVVLGHLRSSRSGAGPGRRGQARPRWRSRARSAIRLISAG